MHKVKITGPMSIKLVSKLHIFGIFAGVLTLGLWWIVFGNSIIELLWGQLEYLMWNLVIIAGTVIGHELCHYLSYPKNGKRRIGLHKKLLSPYSQYDGSLTRYRYFFVSIAPFLILTLAPLVLALVIKFSMGLTLVSIINATLSAADLYVAFNIWLKAPKGFNVDYDENGFFAHKPSCI